MAKSKNGCDRSSISESGVTMREFSCKGCPRRPARPYSMAWRKPTTTPSPGARAGPRCRKSSSGCSSASCCWPSSGPPCSWPFSEGPDDLPPPGRAAILRAWTGRWTRGWWERPWPSCPVRRAFWSFHGPRSPPLRPNTRSPFSDQVMVILACPGTGMGSQSRDWQRTALRTDRRPTTTTSRPARRLTACPRRPAPPRDRVARLARWTDACRHRTLLVLSAAVVLAAVRVAMRLPRSGDPDEATINVLLIFAAFAVGGAGLFVTLRECLRPDTAPRSLTACPGPGGHAGG